MKIEKLQAPSASILPEKEDFQRLSAITVIRRNGWTSWMKWLASRRNSPKTKLELIFDRCQWDCVFRSKSRSWRSSRTPLKICLQIRSWWIPRKRRRKNDDDFFDNNTYLIMTIEGNSRDSTWLIYWWMPQYFRFPWNELITVWTPIFCRISNYPFSWSYLFWHRWSQTNELFHILTVHKQSSISNTLHHWYS